MNLFDDDEEMKVNLLPQDGCVYYYGKQLSVKEAKHYFSALFEKILWKNDEAFVMGKRILTKRKVAWYGNKPYLYTYSNTTKVALPWIAELKALKELVEKKTGESYNACLLNLYHNGDEAMAWHCDAEKDLKPNGAIASLSLGAQRQFSFKHRKSKESISIFLEDGSILLMKDETQSHWLHRLPPSKKIHIPRISLTFRTIVE